MPSALVVGINAAPLVAPRTGVGRYILGLLAGLRSIAPIGGGGDSQEVEVRALFAPASALGAAGPASRRERGPRRLAKALPFAYEVREALRAAALLLEPGLSLLHETNHAAPRTRLPVVLTVHDLCTLLYPETQEPARARFFARALRERAREAQQVITPTAAIARQVVALLGVEAARVHAIHHGIDDLMLGGGASGDAPLPPDEDRRRRALGLDGPYLLFVGALEPRKGLPVLLDAYDQLPAALARALPLVLAGPAQRVDRALSRRLEARRAGRVVQTGFVAPGDLPALYRGAAALCLPSMYEGFGLPLAEALACGTPCVVSDDPSLVEVAAGAALVAPRGDAAAFAGHLAALYADPSLREGLSSAGRARAAAFRWEASARAHLAVYRAALEGP